MNCGHFNIGDALAVVWNDSKHSFGWVSDEDYKGGICEITSVGFLWRNEYEWIALAPHVGQDPKQACGIITIPTDSIKEAREISLL